MTLIQDVPAALLAGDRAAPPRTLVDILETVVASAPDAVALDSGVQTMTYAELDSAARQLAERLAGHGIGRGAKVGVRIKSGTTDLYTAIVGILYAGAAYVPVDADDPTSGPASSSRSRRSLPSSATSSPSASGSVHRPACQARGPGWRTTPG